VKLDCVHDLADVARRRKLRDFLGIVLPAKASSAVELRHPATLQSLVDLGIDLLGVPAVRFTLPLGPLLGRQCAPLLALFVLVCELIDAIQDVLWSRPAGEIVQIATDRAHASMAGEVLGGHHPWLPFYVVVRFL
jgi:hypothetical protein